MNQINNIFHIFQYLNSEYIMINPYITLLVSNYIDDFGELYKRTEGFIVHTQNNEKVLFFADCRHIPNDIKETFTLTQLLKDHNDISLKSIIITYVSYRESFIDTIFSCSYEGLILQQDLSRITDKDKLIKLITRLYNFIISIHTILKNLNLEIKIQTVKFLQDFRFTDRQISILKKFDINTYKHYQPTETDRTLIRNIIKNKSMTFKYNLFSVKYGKVFINNVLVNEDMFIKFLKCTGLFDNFINTYEYKKLTEV